MPGLPEDERLGALLGALVRRALGVGGDLARAPCPRSAWKTSNVEVDGAPHARLARRRNDVGRADRIHLLEHRRPRHPLLEDPHAVDHRLGALGCAADQGRVGNVAARELHLRREQLPALPSSRTSATTSSPRSASRRATAFPSFPVPPVTSTRMSDQPSQTRYLRADSAGPGGRDLHCAPDGPLPRTTGSVFHCLNASIEFDRRLAPQDIEGSRAHAQALHAAGVLDDSELERITEGLDAIERELGDGSFGFHPDDEDIHVAIERRLTEIAGPVGGATHRAFPQRPGRHRHGAVRA